MAKTAYRRWRGFGSRTSLDQSPYFKATRKNRKKSKPHTGWIQFKAKYSGKCECGNRIRQGKMTWYNPTLKVINCYPCGPHIVKSKVSESSLSRHREVQ